MWRGFRTDVLRLCLEVSLHAEASQADDVAGLQAAVPADTNAVPQHHAHAPRAVAHLQHSLGGDVSLSVSASATGRRAGGVTL